jgi:hypothetical protein
MKFMIMMKSDSEMEAGVAPSEQQLSEFIRFNSELVQSGALLAGEGLLPSSRGARVGRDSTVTDGPFAETKELIAGFWVVSAASLAEAVERMRHIPDVYGRKPVLEVRQCVEPVDFGAVMTPDLLATEVQARQQSARLAARVQLDD